MNPLLWLRSRRLRSKNHDTRAAAFAAATRRRDVDALLAVIDDPDPYTRMDAIRALGQIGEARAVPALIKRLDDANFNNVEDAARALARIGDARAVEPLFAVIRSSKQHGQARRTAATELAKLADAKAVPLLLEALADPDADTRYFALEVLGTAGNSRAVPRVIAALSDRDERVRSRAVAALGALGDGRAVDPLLAQLAPLAPTGTGYEPKPLIEALGQIGDRRAAPALVSFLRHGNSLVRATAAAALDAVGWQPADGIEGAQHAIASRRWDRFARIEWEVARAALLAAARTEDFFAARDAVATLAKVGGKRAFDPLLEALANPDDDVANTAALALAELGDVRAVVPLLAHARRYCPLGGYKNDPGAPQQEHQRAEKATAPLVQLLERTLAQVAPDVLDMLARQEDRGFGLSVEYDTPGYGDGRDDFSIVQKFARVRRLATKEQGRRGLV